MKLKVNREFLRRHLFAAALIGGMGVWFGYDGYVRYPSMTPEALYADAHKGASAPDGEAAAKFYSTAIPRQRQFMALCLLAAAAIALHLALVARFRFEFDESGFEFGGRRYFYGEIRQVNRKRWKKSGILVISVGDRKIRLDAWHHTGVAEFEKLVSREGVGDAART